MQTDGNHNVTSIADGFGTPLARYVFTPYGQRTVLSANWGVTSDAYGFRAGFQGGLMDPVTQNWHFRNRDLNSFLGIWTKPDPIGYPDGANRYVLVENSPVAATDPLGLWEYSPKVAAQLRAAGYTGPISGEGGTPWTIVDNGPSIQADFRSEDDRLPRSNGTRVRGFLKFAGGGCEAWIGSKIPWIGPLYAAHGGDNMGAGIYMMWNGRYRESNFHKWTRRGLQNAGLSSDLANKTSSALNDGFSAFAVVRPHSPGYIVESQGMSAGTQLNVTIPKGGSTQMNAFYDKNSGVLHISNYNVDKTALASPYGSVRLFQGAITEASKIAPVKEITGIPAGSNLKAMGGELHFNPDLISETPWSKALLRLGYQSCYDKYVMKSVPGK